MRITKNQLLQLIKEEIENVRLADVAHEYKMDYKGKKDQWNNATTLSNWVKSKGYKVDLQSLKKTLGITGE